MRCGNFIAVSTLRTASIPSLRLDQEIERIALKGFVNGEHNMAVEFLDAQFAAAHIVAKLIVMLDIAAEHPHQIIDPATDFVALQDFVAFADRGQKTLEIGFAVVFRITSTRSMTVLEIFERSKSAM